MFDLEPRTLRVYENERLIAPEHTATQRRTYSRQDIERIRLIRQLNAHYGINLAGVKLVFAVMAAAGKRKLAIPADQFPELAAARHLWD